MMFQAGTAFAQELIALGIGFWVLLKTQNAEAENLKGFGTFIGYFIIVSTFLAILCTSYYTVKYWEDGHFVKPNAGQVVMMQRMHDLQNCDHNMMSGQMGMHGDQCNKMMEKGSMNAKCEKMMKGGMGDMMGNKSGMQEGGDHAAHHPQKKDQ